jgi:uncharacterized membrane protein YdcZ (DUF606 family)
MAVVGGFIALQAPINAGFGRATGNFAAATVTGQLATSVVLDRIGFLGLEQEPITPARVLGVVLLLAGTYLVVR